MDAIENPDREDQTFFLGVGAFQAMPSGPKTFWG